MAQFFVFSADDRKKSVTVCTNYLSALGRSYRVLTVCEISRVEKSKKTAEWVKKYQNIVFSKVNLATGSPESNNPHYFLKELNTIFEMYLNIFAVISRKYKT